MRPSTDRKTGPRKRPRSRYGYDHHWWGEPPRPPENDQSYWLATRRPLPSLVFILPILIGYEAGVVWIGGPSADALRAGADAWVRHGLNALGMTYRWILPIGLVAGLLAWQVLDRRDWRFAPSTLIGMVVESLVLAFVLIGLSKAVDLAFSRLEGPSLLATSNPRHPIAPVVGFLGAGLYEETLFRLALIPLLYRTLRMAMVPPLVSCTLAITASSLLFSMAHHAGEPGEIFTWFAFVFRWLAGVFFAWVFVARGFGVAVGTHTAYDLLVGWFDVHL